jgi:2-oxo-4-hydroxy-4-carboxy-5-ureidoimidazoline decarboxylase
MEPWRSFNDAAADDARRMLLSCCGSTRWAARMLTRRPFTTREDLLEAARREWFALTEDDWREAFHQHPKIGDRTALRQRFPATHHLSAQEQAGVGTASDDVLDALAEGNRAYEARFGYIFIVCATGRSANEMLAMLQERLDNEPAHEIGIAAEEQANITELRLGSVRL